MNTFMALKQMPLRYISLELEEYVKICEMSRIQTFI